MRIFSSAEYCLRVARRMSWTTFSAGSLDDRVCCLIFAPVNVTMSQKLSLLQSANSVSRALTADIWGQTWSFDGVRGMSAFPRYRPNMRSLDTDQRTIGQEETSGALLIERALDAETDDADLVAG